MDVYRLCMSVALQFYDILEAASCLRGVTGGDSAIPRLLREETALGEPRHTRYSKYYKVYT